jgi:integrase
MEHVMRYRPGYEYLVKEKARGKTFWYVRIDKGPRYRLRAEPGTPEFRREYLAAVAKAEQGIAPSEPAKGGAKVGSLEWLWGAYTGSTAWTNGLKPSTRYQRERLMAHVLKKVGKVPADAITSKSIINGLEERAKTPSAAKNFLSTMRHLFGWAKKHGHVQVDPTFGVEGVARPKTTGHPVWTDDDCAKFVEKWPLGTRQYLAFAVHRYTGLRRGDAVLLGRQHFRKDGTIQIASTEKNGVELIIPIHPKLVEAIKGARRPACASSKTPLGNLGARRRATATSSTIGRSKLASSNPARRRTHTASERPPPPRPQKQARPTRSSWRSSDGPTPRWRACTQSPPARGNSPWTGALKSALPARSSTCSRRVSFPFWNRRRTDFPLTSEPVRGKFQIN